MEKNFKKNKMNSNQFFRNKIRNLRPDKEIIKTVNSWIGKTYYKSPKSYEILSCEKLTQKEIDNKFSKLSEDLEVYELKTSEIGHRQEYMQITINKNHPCGYHSIIY